MTVGPLVEYEGSYSTRGFNSSQGQECVPYSRLGNSRLKKRSGVDALRQNGPMLRTFKRACELENDEGVKEKTRDVYQSGSQATGRGSAGRGAPPGD